MTTRRTWVEINENALKNNINALRSLLNPGTRFCAVVKANAYGHGLREVVNIAARTGVDAFAVDTIDDALEIRSILPSALIVVLGYTLHDRLNDAIGSNIELTLYDKESIKELEKLASAKAKSVSFHLKIETGTSRQGILECDLDDYLELIAGCGHLKLNGVSTHFANIEDGEDPSYANLQFSRFIAARDRISAAGFSPEHIHCACSAAIILYPDTHQTLVRAGVSMYGMWSSEDTQNVARRHNIHIDLQPVMTWKTRIAQIKSLPAGTPIGYGLTHVLSRASRIAVLPVGYWDGYDRGLSSQSEVLVSGQKCKILGRVCMNMMIVDVSTVPDAEPEQEVVLLGRMGRFEISAEELAGIIETINYEIQTRINPLLPRIVV